MIFSATHRCSPFHSAHGVRQGNNLNEISLFMNDGNIKNDIMYGNEVECLFNRIYAQVCERVHKMCLCRAIVATFCIQVSVFILWV